MRVIGLPALPARYALTRWETLLFSDKVGKLEKFLLAKNPLIAIQIMLMMHIQGGRNLFHERPLHRAQVTDSIS